MSIKPIQLRSQTIPRFITVTLPGFITLGAGGEMLIPRLIARHVPKHITVYIAVNRDTQQRVGVDGSNNRLFANQSTTVPQLSGCCGRYTTRH